MAHMTGLLAASSSAPADWVYGALASIVFVVVIAVPAAWLNSREHKKRQREQSAAP
jgi:hypothetical protein